jgi:hypothetical protein
LRRDSSQMGRASRTRIFATRPRTTTPFTWVQEIVGSDLELQRHRPFGTLSLGPSVWGYIYFGAGHGLVSIHLRTERCCDPLLVKTQRHVGTRTPDLYRVNFEVNNLKPFPHLAFPHFPTPENTSKQLGFDGELMASSFQRYGDASPITGVMARRFFKSNGLWAIE